MTLDHYCGGVPRVLLSAIPVKRGGGVSATSTLLLGAESAKSTAVALALVVREDAKVSVPKRFPGEVFRVSSKRLVAEAQLARITRKVNPNWVLSTFGPAPLFRTRESRHAVYCAYSNLFFPEVNFWGGKSFLGRIVAKAKDRARLRWTLAADVVFLESPTLERRARELFGEHRTNFRTILPSFDAELSAELAETLRQRTNGDFRILLFSGFHPNKNWHRIPTMARHMSDMGVSDVSFVFTVDETDPNVFALISAVNQVEGFSAEAIGRVNRRRRASILRSVDCLMLLSSLESFSNNLSEAWAADLPLVLPRLEWAGVAGDAAVFVDPDDDSVAAAELAELISAARSQETLDLIRAGRRALNEMPSPEDKFQRVMDILLALET